MEGQATVFCAGKTVSAAGPGPCSPHEQRHVSRTRRKWAVSKPIRLGQFNRFIIPSFFSFLYSRMSTAFRIALLLRSCQRLSLLAVDVLIKTRFSPQTHGDWSDWVIRNRKTGALKKQIWENSISWPLLLHSALSSLIPQLIQTCSIEILSYSFIYVFVFSFQYVLLWSLWTTADLGVDLSTVKECLTLANLIFLCLQNESQNIKCTILPPLASPASFSFTTVFLWERNYVW